MNLVLLVLPFEYQRAVTWLPANCMLRVEYQCLSSNVQARNCRIDHQLYDLALELLFLTSHAQGDRDAMDPRATDSVLLVLTLGYRRAVARPSAKRKFRVEYHCPSTNLQARNRPLEVPDSKINFAVEKPLNRPEPIGTGRSNAKKERVKSAKSLHDESEEGLEPEELSERPLVRPSSYWSSRDD